MAAWREAYAAFGSKPNRTRNSAEALAKRALADGGLPRINRLVDVVQRDQRRPPRPGRRRGHRPHQGGDAAGAGHRRGAVRTRSRAARRPSSTPTRAKWCGATTRASPAAAGTGARECGPGSPRSPSTRSSCWRAWRRTATWSQAGAELAELLEKFSPGARITVHAPVGASVQE